MLDACLNLDAETPLVCRGSAGSFSTLAVSVTVRVELAQEAAKEAETRADSELRSVLEDVLRRLRRVGRKLLSMNVHLFPVKEWSLGGEVSALFVKGSISVTFGTNGTSRRP